MKLKIVKSLEETKHVKELPIIEEQEDLIVQGTELVNEWTNEEGDKFFVLGEIIGIRYESNYKLGNQIDWNLFEKQENSEKIEGSILSNSIRKIEMTTNYKIFDSYKNIVIYEDSFSRYSLLGPIDSLFSREQSERNARKRLGVSISNDIIIRLIQWAEFNN